MTRKQIEAMIQEARDSKKVMFDVENRRFEFPEDIEQKLAASQATIWSQFLVVDPKHMIADYQESYEDSKSHLEYLESVINKCKELLV